MYSCLTGILLHVWEKAMPTSLLVGCIDIRGDEGRRGEDKSSRGKIKLAGVRQRQHREDNDRMVGSQG